MDNELFLQEIGLTKNEIKVYKALLNIGQTTTLQIIKNTGVNTSKVYESLERLLKKGLVSYIIVKNRKNWKAENPSRIKEFLDEEKEKIQEKSKQANQVIANLIKTQNKEKSEEVAYSIFEGIKGIKTAREKVLEVLKKGETFYLILASYPSDNNLEAYYLDFQKRRALKGINCKYILNEDFKNKEVRREKFTHTEVRYVKPKILTPTWIEIFGDYVSIGILGEHPSVFLIKNKGVVEGFLNYFDFLWKIAKK
ncbi:MAG: helix-turn-helix domain-containing protein [Candidatus Woesearchaeota archaeon]|nr:helix-turn-helix domain-containing protein [Candidatus Woesearchaeota archaeon]